MWTEAESDPCPLLFFSSTAKLDGVPSLYESDEPYSCTADGAVSVLRKDPLLELIRASAIASTFDMVARAVLGAILSAIRGRFVGLVKVPGERSPSSEPGVGRVGDGSVL